MTRCYRVWMTIRGSIAKPAYDGYCDVLADSTEAAFDAAIEKSRRSAHFDSPPSDFRLQRIEVIS